MSKQHRLSHFFGSSKAPASRGTAAEDTENEETEAEEEQEDEAEEDEPETDEDEAEGGEDEEGDDDDSASAAGLAAVNVMTSPEAKGREKLATSLAKDVARGAISEKRAVALLKAAPRTGGLAKAMQGRDQNPGQDARPGAGAGGGKLAAHDQSLVAAAERRAKQRAERRR